MNVVVLIVAAALIVVGVVLIVVAIVLGTDRGSARAETEKEEVDPTPPTGRTFLDEPLSRDMAEELGSTPKETEGDEGAEASSSEVTPGDSETEEPKNGRATPVEEPLSADAVRKASYDFRVELAGKLMAAGEFEEAIGEYQKALGLTDKRAERRDLLIEVASAHNALHRYEAAAEAYDDAAALADSDLGAPASGRLGPRHAGVGPERGRSDPGRGVADEHRRGLPPPRTAGRQPGRRLDRRTRGCRGSRRQPTSSGRLSIGRRPLRGQALALRRRPRGGWRRRRDRAERRPCAPGNDPAFEALVERRLDLETARAVTLAGSPAGLVRDYYVDTETGDLIGLAMATRPGTTSPGPLPVIPMSRVRRVRDLVVLEDDYALHAVAAASDLPQPEPNHGAASPPQSPGDAGARSSAGARPPQR